MPSGSGGMGLVRQIINVGILYALFIISKYAYNQQFVTKEPISVTELLGKFNVVV